MLQHKHIAKIRIELGVTFNLNDSSPEDVRKRIERLVALAVEGGLLTDGHDAEVDSYSTDTRVMWQATQVAPVAISA